MKQYLTFRSESLHFGLETIYIREIFSLPELQSVVEAPGDVIGLLNLRGTVIPVIHLAKRLGIARPTCKITDSMIVIEWQGLQVGLVVNQVEDVKDIVPESIVNAIDLERDQYINSALVDGLAQLDEELLTLLHPASLIRQADDVAVMAWEAKLSEGVNHDVSPSEDGDLPCHRDFYEFCDAVTAADRMIFARRAQELQAPFESYDISERQPITIMSLDGEYFGVALDSVREFIKVPSLTRIPCAPPYIIGNFNLRGEIITLLDLSTSLELEYLPCGHRPKAVILEINHQRIGVSVDDVHDVLYLALEDYLDFPATIAQSHQEFLMGAFDYQGSVIRLINLPALINSAHPGPSIV